MKQRLLATAQEQVVCLEIGSALMDETALLLGCQLDLESRYELPCQLVLNGEDVSEIAIVSVGPHRAPHGGIDQLGCNADAVAGLAPAAFKHVTDAEGPSHFWNR